MSFKEIKDDKSFGGKGLEATKDIKQGEVIINEEALITGPCGDTTYPICLSCYRVITVEAHICNGCKWPVCSEICEKAAIHAKYECRVFKNCKVKPIKSQEIYFYITVLRSCMLKEINAKKYDQLFKLYPTEPKGGKPKKLIAPVKTADFIYKNCNKKEFDQEMLTKIDTIVRTCSFSCSDVLSLQTPPRMARLLFGNAGLMSHDCQANATWTRIENPDNSFSIQVSACVDIKAGERITLHFLDCSRPYIERKFHLQEVHNFTCQCRLCSDPTHGGIYYGAVKCSKCPAGKGFLLSTEPLKFSDAIWKCDNCKNQAPYRQVVVPIETTVFEEILKCGEEEEFEKVLETYSGKDLHANHWLMMDCRQEIVKRMYGFITTIKPVDKMVEAAQKMLQYCNALNPRIECIYPGHNRLRARHLLYIKYAETVMKGEGPEVDLELDWIEELIRKGKEMDYFQKGNESQT